MIKNSIFSLLAAASISIAATQTVHSQTLFDEMIIDGETVNTDTVAPARSGEGIHWRSTATTVTIANSPAEPAKEATTPLRRRINPRKQSRASEVPSLWALTDTAGNLLDSTLFGPQELYVDPDIDVSGLTLPRITFLPPIFYSYSMQLPGKQPDAVSPDSAAITSLNWAEQAAYRNARFHNFMQRFMIDNPSLVRYNINNMPRPPKEYVMEVINPSEAKITITEFERNRDEMVKVAKPVEFNRINWLSTFEGSLQFSQAYISPNWYQGGQSNLNAILNLYYNIKLNPAFHPNLIFDTSFQYKLGMNNAPDDTVHSYNITEDLFQVNSKFGIKAFNHWYYTITGQFKTQLLNSYPSNSHTLRSAFMSPGELNLGVGMTYSIQNARKTIDFNAALSPLSYNLKTCINHDLKPTSFGIEEGKHHSNQFGSSAELTLRAKLAYNIEYFSRLFMFTDYEMGQGDWENTITFNINRFLSTKIFAHLRYQSDVDKIPDTKWNKWQFKEILSIGFSYKFSR